MGWLDFFRRPSMGRTLTLGDFPLLQGMLDPPAMVGVYVNETTALNLSAYWNGVDVISSQKATLPLPVYQRLSNDERVRAVDHPAYKVLHDQPNEYMTPFIFWQTLMAHALTWGNAYAEIRWDVAMRPIGLYPITPDRLCPEVVGEELVYRYTGGTKRVIKAKDVLHIPGLGFDGLRGYSVVAMARRSLGVGMAAQSFGGSFFANGAWPGLVLEHPKTLSPAAQERLIASVDGRHKGPDKAHRTFIAEEGMKVVKVGIPPEDAQFLETREFEVVEIARWLNLPTWKLKVQQDARPGGNPETSQIEFLTDTLAPWLVRIEQECNRKLLTEDERRTFYSEHLVDNILRMDSASRASAYKSYIDMGVMTPDQVAKKENLPAPKDRQAPIADRIENVGQLIRAGFDPQASLEAVGLPGIKHTGLVPVTVTADTKAPPHALPQAPPPPVAPPPPPAKAKAQRMNAAIRTLTIELVTRFARREGEKAKRAAKQGPGALAAWAADFYPAEAQVLADYLAHPVELQLAEAGLEGEARTIARRLAEEYVERSQEEFLDLPAAGLEGRVLHLVDAWDARRAAEFADKITALEG